MSRDYLIIFFVFIFQFFESQYSLSGKITDENDNPLNFVSISILNSSKVVKQLFTNKNGIYEIKNLSNGNYSLKFNYPIYKVDSTRTLLLDKDTIINLRINKVKNIEEVRIEGIKPLIESKIDRIRFNVSNSNLVKGNNIWEVIEKTPLVTVLSDGNIQLNGTSNAVVYINDKKKMLSGVFLKSYLSGIPSEDLEAIEVLTSPSSKYESEGGAGIINVILKKNKNDGINGTGVMSMRQTRVNSQSSSLNLNYRKNNLNLYSTMYYGERNRNPDAQKEIIYSQANNYLLKRRYINSANINEYGFSGFNLGMDYDLSAKSTMGILLDYSRNKDTEKRQAFSYDFYQNADSLTLTNNLDKLKSQNFSLNANYMYKLDSLGKKMNIDYDLLLYNSQNNSLVETTSLNPTDNIFINTLGIFRSSSPQNIKSNSIKIDFEWPFNKDISLDFGGKVGFSNINNNLTFEDNVDMDTWTKDESRSNNFRYNENIGAFYISLNHAISKKWSYQLGSRLENTSAKGWLENIEVFNKNYTSIFPTAFLKYTNEKGNSFNLAISSRITRPSFWDMNPFRTYITNQAYFEGNPFLQPSRYYRQELSHTFKQKKSTFVFQIATSQTLDEFYALPFNPSSVVIVNKKVNYGNKYGYTGSFIYYGQIAPWWKISGTLLTGYVISKGEYENLLINNKTFLLNLSTNQTFTISKKSGITCTLLVNNSFPATIVNTKIGNRLDTEIRLRKSLMNFNITLSIQDLLKTNTDRYKIDVGDLNVYDNYYNDTRSIALAVSYSFGKKSVKEKRDRETEFSEVKQRIK